MKWIYQIVFFLVSFSFTIQAQTSGDRYAYISYFKDIAIQEMERTGVPASIKLAQGILESNAGTSYLAVKANNHFGIKCGSSWKGKKAWREDDDFDKNGKLRKSCFRAYKSAEESYIAHSNFLRNPKKKNRYSFLFDLDPTDYKAWAKGLKKAGYATSKTYAQKLITVVETYELFRFDHMTSADVLAHGSSDVKKKKKKRNPSNAPLIDSEVIINNDVRMVFARADETPDKIAERVDVKLKCILKYNEEMQDPNEKLAQNTRVYLQPKRSGHRGKRKWHYVQDGETMYEIAQLYGVKLSKLLKRNLLPKGAEPTENERIKLRGWKIRSNERPKLRPPSKSSDAPPKTKKEEIEEDPFMDDETITPEKPEESKVEDPEKEDPPVLEPPKKEDPPTPEPPTSQGDFHVVQKGDTLYSISRKYDTSVDVIKQLNGLTSNVISLGQKLRVK